MISHLGKSPANKGMPRSEEAKKKISDALMGRTSPMLNKKHTEETRRKMSENHADFRGKKSPIYGKKNESATGENNASWKGKNVSYRGLHYWIRKHKQKVECCEWCGEKKKLELANVTGRYTRCFDEYQWFCIKCHRGYDLKVRNLKEMTDNINKHLDDAFGGETI